MVDNPTYTSYLSQLLGTLRSSVIQTRSSSQVMILAAILKAVSSLASNTVAVQGSNSISLTCTLRSKYINFNFTRFFKIPGLSKNIPLNE